MKLTVLLMVLGTFPLLAIESQTTIIQKLKKSPYSVDMEAFGTINQNSADNNFNGLNTLVRVHTSYNFPNGNRLRLRQEFNTFFGSVYGDEENKYQSTQAHYKFKKILNVKDNGVKMDVSLRAVYNTLSEQREAYGSNGNLQARFQFGRAFGGLYLFSSYRFEDYLSNKYATSKSRDYRHRVRFWPSYKINDNWSVANKFEYTNNVLENGFNDREIELMPEVKYSFNKDYAISLSYIIKPIDNAKSVGKDVAIERAQTSLNLFAKFF